MPGFQHAASFFSLKGPLVSFWGDHGAEAGKFTRQEKFTLPSYEFLDCSLLERRSQGKERGVDDAAGDSGGTQNPGHRRAQRGDIKDQDLLATGKGGKKPALGGALKSRPIVQLGCATSYSPGRLFVGHLSEVSAKMPCVFQDPWGLVLPRCQAEGGTVDASPGSPLRHVWPTV